MPEKTENTRVAQQQHVAAVLLLVLCLAGAAREIDYGAYHEPIATTGNPIKLAKSGAVDETPHDESMCLSLSQVTQPQLEALPEIGPTLAARIINWRTQRHAPPTVRDLVEVHGVGSKSVAKLKVYFCAHTPKNGQRVNDPVF